MAALRVAEDLDSQVPLLEFPWPSRWTCLLFASAFGLFCLWKGLRHVESIKQLRYRRGQIRARQVRITQGTMGDSGLKGVYDVGAVGGRGRDVAVNWRMQVKDCACVTALEEIHNCTDSDPAVTYVRSKGADVCFICCPMDSMPGEIHLLVSGKVQYALSPGWIGPVLSTLPCVSLTLWKEGKVASITARLSQHLTDLLCIPYSSSSQLRVGCTETLYPVLSTFNLNPVILPKDPFRELCAAKQALERLEHTCCADLHAESMAASLHMSSFWLLGRPHPSYSAAYQRFGVCLHSFLRTCGQNEVSVYCYESDDTVDLTCSGLSLASTLLPSSRRMTVLGRPGECLRMLAAVEVSY